MLKMGLLGNPIFLIELKGQVSERYGMDVYGKIKRDLCIGEELLSKENLLVYLYM